LSPKKRDRVIEIFRQIGYQESVWIDEWQAGLNEYI